MDQVKVFSLFGTFLVGTAGREYVHDFERYDFRLLLERRDLAATNDALAGRYQ